MFSVVVLGKIVVSLAITEAACTPVLHSRIFTETEKYRDQEFTTCKVFKTNILSIYLCKFILFFFFNFAINCGRIGHCLSNFVQMIQTFVRDCKESGPFCDYADINLG